MAPDTACLITNESAVPAALAECSILRRCTTRDLLDLGAAWGMENVLDKSADCIIILRKDWNATFEEQHWMLVPVKITLRQILFDLLLWKTTGIHRPWNEVCDPAKPYAYELVPFTLGSLVIQRNSRDKYGPTTDTFEAPYAKFPKLSPCGLHPYFVIFSAYTAFRENEHALKYDHMDTYALLKTIVDLWYEYLTELREDQAKWEQASWDAERAEEQEQVCEQEQAQEQAQGHGHEQQPVPPAEGNFSSDTLLDQPTHLENPGPSDQPPLVGQTDASEPTASAPDRPVTVCLQHR
ncbi:hypothetical protein EVG20_g10407 [Dentipellis fragilis]|uniref:Uncharacterized protein n=1 Tax=Dentipellis fragilis TaxID=205917 RepID=A0A4Y9XR22_9AGAM|nr:hypothetical protein EVG20_g10407 [Dentipellis fragilis]